MNKFTRKLMETLSDKSSKGDITGNTSSQKKKEKAVSGDPGKTNVKVNPEISLSEQRVQSILEAFSRTKKKGYSTNRPSSGARPISVGEAKKVARTLSRHPKSHGVYDAPGLPGVVTYINNGSMDWMGSGGSCYIDDDGDYVDRRVPQEAPPKIMIYRAPDNSFEATVDDVFTVKGVPGESLDKFAAGKLLQTVTDYGW